MGHVDGLSRLHAATICALSLNDLLNPGSDGGSVEVGESALPDHERHPTTDAAAEENPSVETTRPNRDVPSEVGERPRSARRTARRNLPPTEVPWRKHCLPHEMLLPKSEIP